MDEQIGSIVEEPAASTAPAMSTPEGIPAAEQAPASATGEPASPMEQAKQAVANTAQAMQESPFGKTLRQVLLAGVGVVALTKDELEEFARKLVERGEIAEADAKKMMREMRDEQKKRMDEQLAEQRKRLNEKIGMGRRRAKKIEGVVDQRIEAALTCADIPTKQDFETLSEKITVLSEKIDALKKPKAS